MLFEWLDQECPGHYVFDKGRLSLIYYGISNMVLAIDDHSKSLGLWIVAVYGNKFFHSDLKLESDLSQILYSS